MEILGCGIDGVVIFPPIDCIETATIEQNNFVGKIYYKQKSPIEVKAKIDELPDEFDGVLYYKENYLCDIILPEALKISYNNKLSNNQLILRRVLGEVLETKLDALVMHNDSCGFFEVLKASINTYYMIKVLADKHVFYNDYSTANIIFDITGKLMLIDLDDITYGKSKGKDKRFLSSNNPNIYYEGKTGYIHWHSNYISSIIIPILRSMFEAYHSVEDNFIMDTFDEKNQSIFRERMVGFEKLLGGPYSSLNHLNIDNVRDNLDTLYREVCKIEGLGIRNKKIKNKKRRRTKKTNRYKIPRLIRTRHLPLR
jgi:hypothetical protein